MEMEDKNQAPKVNPNPAAQYTYQATQISTATKEQLLLITYDIAIRSCRIAEGALTTEDGRQDLVLANREILRAQDVIRELMVTLNTEKGGEMAQNLMRLYDYMYQRLVEANIKKDPKTVVTVRTMLEELKSTWEEALMKLLREYQAAHPEDADLQTLKDLPISSAAPQEEAEKTKTGGLNIAG